jgi:hypothetical protein
VYAFGVSVVSAETWLSQRERRAALVATVCVAIAFVATAIAPLSILLVGPIVLGVPHVVSDVRYLVARPRLHTRWPLWILVGVPLVACFFGGGVRAGLVATAGALVAARGPFALRALCVATCGALFAIAWRVGPIADLAFAHLHNFLAVGIWWAWRRREQRVHAIPLAAFAIGCGALLFGVAAPSIAGYPFAIGVGLVPTELATLGGRIVALYAFAQLMHYAVWLRLVPNEDREDAATRSWRDAARALRADIGPWVLAMATLGALGFAAYAFVDLVAARTAYLNAAVFHGHLELAACALLFVEGRARADESLPRFRSIEST